MSWQAYVDTSLVGTGQFDKAAIFSADGTSCWATSPGFTISPEEMKIIVESFTDTAEEKYVQKNSFKIEGVKYMCLSSTEEHLYGRSGKAGVVIVKTAQALLVGHYPEGVQAGVAVETMEQVADHLRKSGY